MAAGLGTIKQIAENSRIGLALSLQPTSGVGQAVFRDGKMVFPGIPDPDGPHGSLGQPSANNRGTVEGNKEVQYYLQHHLMATQGGASEPAPKSEDKSLGEAVRGLVPNHLGMRTIVDTDDQPAVELLEDTPPP